MRHALGLLCRPSAAAEARAAIRGIFDGQVDRDSVEVAELLVSELVTNAIVHTRSDRLVLVVDVTDAGIRVELGDRGALFEGPLKRELLAESGRGLLLVDRLATTWGVRTGARGKSVWFELSPGVVTPTNGTASAA